MKSENNSTSIQAPSQPAKRPMSSTSEMLMPSEIQALRQDQKEASDWMRKELARNPIR